MPDWLGWLLAPAVLGFAYKLHYDAVRAERGRADDARARAEAAEKRADTHWEQIGILLGRAKEPP